MKEIVLEELQEVPVTRLSPLLITSKSRGGRHQRVGESGREWEEMESGREWEEMESGRRWRVGGDGE